MLLPISRTPKIKGTRAISELRSVTINGAEHSFLIRGASTENPIILFVHGGPGCSEIPYVVKYQKELESFFTIVHYDQRGSGKSYHKGDDYSGLSVPMLMDDLECIITYICSSFKKEKLILAAHSFGTEIAIRTAARFPDKLTAYIGIGQMAYTSESEIVILRFCLKGARQNHHRKTYKRLLSLKENIYLGRGAVPRKYVRKYGGAARQINDNRDYLAAFLFRPEYSITDVVRFFKGLGVSQRLYGTAPGQTAEAVRELQIPCFFLQGKYDYMTSTKIAKKYFDEIQAPEKEFVLFEHSAHFPQFEEKEQFLKWMKRFTR